MGGGGSQTIDQTFNLSAINQSIYEQITKTQAKASAAQANVQNLQMKFDNVSGCKIDMSQTIDSSTQSSSELTSQTTTEIKNAITNDLQAAVEAQVQKVSEMGNLQFGDKQNVNQEVTLEVQNIIENTIVTETLNESIASQVSIQGGVIKFGNCLDSEINFDQNITAKLMSKVITKALQNAIASSEILNNLHAAGTGGASSENKGLSDLVTSFFEGLTGPMKYGIIACVVCCCLLVLVMIVIGLSPAGQSATKNMGRAGAVRMGGPMYGRYAY